MTKKLIIGLTAFVLLAAAAVYAAEKAKDKAQTAKPDQPTVTSKGEEAKVRPVQKQKEGLIDQLLKAYKADDKKAMGEIIAKLEKRQKEMKKFAQFEKWHQMAHRKMMQRPGWGCQQGPNRGGCGGCSGMQMNRNWGPPAGSFRPMPQMRNPGGFGPMPQWNQGRQQPNEQAAPPAAKPGDWRNNDNQSPDTEEISAWNDDTFTMPDNEIAMADDTQADSEW